jgi:hypothetical protein
MANKAPPLPSPTKLYRDSVLIRKSLALDILFDKYIEDLKEIVGVHVYRHLEIIMTSIDPIQLKQSMTMLEKRLAYLKQVLELDSKPVIEMQAIYNQALHRVEHLIK